MPHAFISYNDDVVDLAANLRERLSHYQVSAWLFNRDKTLGENAWREIEDQIQKSHVILFLISDRTNKSEGQIKEFDIALRFDKTVFPVIIEPVTFSSITELLNQLKQINGIDLDCRNVQSRALEIVQTFFPELDPSEKSSEWKYPKPSDWLEVCNLDIYTEEYFKLRDEVYFRRISPMGLFECYAPQIKELFWFWPPNLKPASFVDEERIIERERVPGKYRISFMLEIERLGWNASRSK
jgi:hypothetical protein